MSRGLYIKPTDRKEGQPSASGSLSVIDQSEILRIIIELSRVKPCLLFLQVTTGVCFFIDDETAEEEEVRPVEFAILQGTEPLFLQDLR